jgi:hypothetical protein
MCTWNQILFLKQAPRFLNLKKMPKPKSWVLKIEEPGSNLDSKAVRKTTLSIKTRISSKFFGKRRTGQQGLIPSTGSYLPGQNWFQ